VTLNEAFGWTSVLVGLLGGLGLGLGFHREGWLGGYVSLRRRLLRLAHISLVALGILNILFGMAVDRMRMGPDTASVASWSLMIGGFSMPVCCVLAAWRPALRQLFAVPVLSLILGAGLIVLGVWRP
jgi:hypothetical protein